MIDTIHLFIEKFGLGAIFVVCLAEGESAAILGGFFAHQGLLKLWAVFLAAFAGAFGGDAFCFLLGRFFSGSAFVRRLSRNPKFAYAREMVRSHPMPYVMLNRYVYGFRVIGGVVAGLSGIKLPMFLLLNALSSLIWALLFVSLGYIFGLGAEQIVGAAFAKHERLLVGLVLVILVVAAAGLLSRKFGRRLTTGSDASPPI